MSFISSRSLWRNRDLTIVAIGQSVSAVGNTVAATTLLLYMQARGGTSWAVAGVLAAEMVPMVLLGPIAGALVDRFDSRHLIVLSSVWQAVVCAALAFSTTLPLIFTLVFLLGCGTALGNPTFSALLPRIAGEDRITAAASQLATATGLASMAGPGLAGLLYAASGLRGPLLIDAASFAAVTGTAFLVRTRRRVDPQHAAASRIRDGLAIVWTTPIVRALVAMVVAFVVVGEAVNVIEVYLVRGTFHQSASTYGLLGTTLMVAIVVGSALARRWESDRELARALSVGGVVLSGGIALVAIVPSIGWVFALYAIFGVANGVLNVCAGALMIRRTPDEQRGRVLGTFTGIARGAGIGALGLGGVLAGAFTPREVTAMCGIAALLTLCATLPPLLRSAPARELVPAPAE
jgi:MFS family permease